MNNKIKSILKCVHNQLMEKQIARSCKQLLAVDSNGNKVDPLSHDVYKATAIVFIMRACVNKKDDFDNELFNDVIDYCLRYINKIYRFKPEYNIEDCISVLQNNYDMTLMKQIIKYDGVL